MNCILYDRESQSLENYPSGVNTSRPMAGLDRTKYLTLQLIEVDPPEYDPATHQLLSESIITITDELAEISGTAIFDWRIEALPPPPPVPDFAQFQQAIRTENGFTAAFQTAFHRDPFAAASLTSRFDDFRKDGDFGPFLQSMMLVLESLPIEQAAEIGSELLALAIKCHMTSAFIAAVEAALFPGQTLTSP